MMTTFFWEEMLAETIEEVAATGDVADYCTEYESNYAKDGFQPHELGQKIDAAVGTKYLMFSLLCSSRFISQRPDF